MSAKKQVLILCTGNSARSQIAEGLLRYLADDRFVVESAGVEPSVVRPEAIDVMREIGVDISSHRSKSVDEFTGRKFNYVITVCDHARQLCPTFPGSPVTLHWSIEDPATTQGEREVRLKAFRKARNELHRRLAEFIKDRDTLQ